MDVTRATTGLTVALIAAGCGGEVRLVGGGGATGHGGVGGTAATTDATSGGGAGGGGCRATGPWREEVVVDDGAQVSNAVRDTGGRFHVVVEGHGLRLVSGVEGAWTVEELGQPTLWTMALAIAADDSLHLGMGASHWMYQTDYWTNRSGSWQRHPVADDGGPTAVAVHPNGVPHLVHWTYPGLGYRLVVDPTQPTTFDLDATPYLDQPPAMAFDGDGRLWLALAASVDAGLVELRVGRVESDGSLSVMASEPHDHATHVGGMAFDAGGRLHVAYVGESTHAYHGQLDDSGWSSTRLDDEVAFPGVDYPPVLAIAADGEPAVVVTRGDDHQPLYLRRIAGEWHAEAFAQQARWVPALWIDEDGAAHTFSLEVGADAMRRVLYGTNRHRCD